MQPGNPHLWEWLRGELNRRGSIPFSEFMQAALYHPAYGFYSRDAPIIGEDGDYATSPSLHPAFGRAVWRQIREMDALLGSPRPLRLLEVGPGGGHLARDLLTAAQTEGMWPHLRYTLVEASPSLRRRQAERIRELGGDPPVVWAPSLDEAPTAHIIFSNELMDALPVHRLVRTADDSWQELYVTWERDARDRLGFTAGPPIEPRAVAVLEAWGGPFVPGHLYDVNVAAADMLKAMARRLTRRGFLLTMDYGGGADQVYGSYRGKGSLRSFARQERTANPLDRPGWQDLTADVDFDLLQRAGTAAGLRNVGWIEQGRFLLNLGIESEARALAERVRAGDAAAEQELQKVYALYAPEGLGTLFFILIQSRGFSHPPSLTGLRENTPEPAPFAALVLETNP